MTRDELETGLRELAWERTERALVTFREIIYTAPGGAHAVVWPTAESGNARVKCLQFVNGKAVSARRCFPNEAMQFAQKASQS